MDSKPTYKSKGKIGGALLMIYGVAGLGLSIFGYERLALTLKKP